MDHVLIRRAASTLAAAATVSIAATATARAGDAAAGGKVFATECGECHSLRAGKDKKGPSLFGVWGAKSARRDGYAYSDALRTSGLEWTPDNLSAYLADPRRRVPGGKMKYDGLADARQRDNLLAYLEGAR